VTSSGRDAPGGDVRLFAVLLAVALAIRLAFLAVAWRLGFGLLQWDEVAVARNLLVGRGYTFDYYSMFGAAHGPSAFFPPLYVANAWLVLRLFHGLAALAFENVLLSTAVVAAIVVLARRMFGEPVARVAGCLAAIYPPFITRITQGSGLYFKMLLVVLAALALQSLWTHPRRGAAIRAGIAFGALVLTMPDAIVWLALFIAAALVAVARRRMPLGAALLVPLVALLCVAPWIARNVAVFHRFCFVSTNGGFNLYMGQNHSTGDEMDFDAVTALDRRLGGALARADELERDHLLERASFAFIAREPGAAFRHMLGRAVMHWGFRPSNLTAMGLPGPGDQRDYSRSYVLYIWSYVIAYVLLLALAVPGLWLARDRWGEFVPLVLAALWSTIVAALFVVQTKMRLVKVEPLLIPFAALWLQQRLRAVPVFRDRPPS
jgi:4-amino-4-deoxy-L-arabinose transferase-like glycosyltransferase